MQLSAMTQLTHVMWRGPIRYHLTVIDKGHKKMVAVGVLSFKFTALLHKLD